MTTILDPCDGSPIVGSPPETPETHAPLKPLKLIGIDVACADQIVEISESAIERHLLVGHRIEEAFRQKKDPRPFGARPTSLRYCGARRSHHDEDHDTCLRPCPLRWQTLASLISKTARCVKKSVAVMKSPATSFDAARCFAADPITARDQQLFPIGAGSLVLRANGPLKGERHAVDMIILRGDKCIPFNRAQPVAAGEARRDGRMFSARPDLTESERRKAESATTPGRTEESINALGDNSSTSDWLPSNNP